MYPTERDPPTECDPPTQRRYYPTLLALLLLSIPPTALLLFQKPRAHLLLDHSPLPRNAPLLADPTQRYLFYQNPTDAKCPPPDGIFRGTTKICVGLNHYVANLRVLLRESRATNRTPIIKPVCLCARHNNGNFIRTPLTRYLSLNASGVPHLTATDPIPRFLSAIGTYSMRVLPHAAPFAHLAAANESLVVRSIFDEREFVTAEFGVADYEISHPQQPFSIRESRRVHDLASTALAEIRARTPSFVCVRARRGDKLLGPGHLSSYPCLDKCTHPENIARVLRMNNVTGEHTIYLLTNEPQEDFFHPLAALGYPNVLMMRDIHGIASVGQLDNFLAFAVEQALCRHAKGVINSYGLSIAVLEPFDDLFQQPAQFHATLTPYNGDCKNVQSAKDIEGCRLANLSLPDCQHVCS